MLGVPKGELTRQDANRMSSRWRTAGGVIALVVAAVQGRWWVAAGIASAIMVGLAVGAAIRHRRG